MALNFPDSPTLNQIYTDTASGFSYQWDGVVWQSYSAAAAKNISILDDISGSFDGLTNSFPITINGSAFVPANAQQLRVVLGGIVQEPGVDYTVSGSDITFTTPPTGGLDCSIVSLGPAVAVSVPGDGTVTPAKLSTGGPSWNSGGDVYISGITTITNASGTVIAGIGTTALIVEGNARVTGILTVGTSSITLDGTNNTINVGSLNITQSGISGGTPDLSVRNITGAAATFTGNVSVGGTLTYEDVTNIDSVGLITARSGINVTGGDVTLGTGVVISGSTANTFTLSTNGSERLRATSDGKLGLGSSVPDSVLSINGSSAFGTIGSGAPIITLKNTDTGNFNTSQIVNRDSGGNIAGGILFRNDSHGASGNSAILFSTRIGGTSRNPLVIGSNGTVEFDSSASTAPAIFKINSSEVARIDSSGRLLVGMFTYVQGNSYTTGNLLNVSGGSGVGPQLSTYSADAFALGIDFSKSRSASVGTGTIVQSGDALGNILFNGHDGTSYKQAATITAFVDGTPGANTMPGRLVFSTTSTTPGASPTEQMRITQSGVVRIASTDDSPGLGDTVTGFSYRPSDNVLYLSSNATSLSINRNTDGNIADFRRSGGSVIGSISVTTTATAYNTSSDYRLKENVTAVTDGITRLQQLKPSRFNFIADPAKTVDGFLAHEVQTVVPEAISGEKDAVDDDGNPIYQGIDQSKLVPLLTAALQEAVAEINALKDRLTAAGI